MQINTPEYGNLPVVVATLNDGEQFGELSLISLNKLQDSAMKTIGAGQFQRRKATCLTVEHCDLLAISKEVSIQLYQPEASANFRKHNRNSMDPSMATARDELNEKIAFLQSIPLFEDIDA